ncbi:MAG: hypothetical protein EOO38_26125 [Cytophagaceae bacterium]|nr:MAG: hypothetical protein EOO38_26125 [Cytophagaceae bacterium]
MAVPQQSLVFSYALAVLMFSLFPPVAAPNMDGLNRWGGHLGAIMLALLFGATTGVFVAAGKEPIKTVTITTAIFVVVMLFLSD